jgi:hypothetical protein
MKIQIIVVPAWIAGIQIRKDASGDIHVTWIPALHAGTTQGGCAYLTRALRRHTFKEAFPRVK